MHKSSIIVPFVKEAGPDHRAACIHVINDANLAYVTVIPNDSMKYQCSAAVGTVCCKGCINSRSMICDNCNIVMSGKNAIVAMYYEWGNQITLCKSCVSKYDDIYLNIVHRGDATMPNISYNHMMPIAQLNGGGSLALLAVTTGQYDRCACFKPAMHVDNYMCIAEWASHDENKAYVGCKTCVGTKHTTCTICKKDCKYSDVVVYEHQSADLLQTVVCKNCAAVTPDDLTATVYIGDDFPRRQTSFNEFQDSMQSEEEEDVVPTPEVIDKYRELLWEMELLANPKYPGLKRLLTSAIQCDDKFKEGGPDADLHRYAAECLIELYKFKIEMLRVNLANQREE